MQVDPIKPTLKAPGTKRLNLKCDELLSSFAFEFNLRRYIKADLTALMTDSQDWWRGRTRITALRPNRASVLISRFMGFSKRSSRGLRVIS